MKPRPVWRHTHEEAAFVYCLELIIATLETVNVVCGAIMLIIIR